MTVSVRRAQALGREAAYSEALRLLDEVETWPEFSEALDVLRESKALAAETVRDLS